MELSPNDVSASDGRCERPAVIGGRQDRARIGRADDIGMHKIGVGAGRKARSDGVIRTTSPLIQPSP